MRPSLISRCRAAVTACTAGGIGLAACAPQAATEQPRALPATAQTAPVASLPMERDEQGRPKSYSVVAYGYNYTDTYIDSFEVDGAGGGNLEVSIPTAGGGKSACCALVTSGLPLGSLFNIKWTRDRKRWCQQDVPLTKPVPVEPRYLEVHFYPDGKIEIEATQRASAPRLKLERFSRGERHETDNANNDEKYSRCKDGYR